MEGPVLAVVGRPNVGKSTFFNRLCGKRAAIVHDMPGVTRDRQYADANLMGFEFQIMDTAGLEEADENSLEGRMRSQTERAIADCDGVLFLIDARAGVTPSDRTFAAMLRKTGKTVILIANKCEGRAAEAGLLDAFSLGLGEPIAFSAEHGLGLADLHNALLDNFDVDEDFANEHLQDDEADHEDAPHDDRPIRVVIMGRPNVGKSTLFNKLLGEERSMTGAEAGITRDAISEKLVLNGMPIELYDTAGMRRKARIDDVVEKLAVGDTLEALKFAEVVVILLDVQCALEEQDLRLIDLVEREGRAVIVALNKWDLVENRQGAFAKWRDSLDHALPQVRGVQLVSLSGHTGEGLARLGSAIQSAYDVWNRRISTGLLNRWLLAAVEAHQPPAAQGRRIRLRYMTQSKARPPTFVAFCSQPEALPESYTRYLVNGLRERFKLPGVPIRFILRKGENPYEGRKKRT